MHNKCMGLHENLALVINGQIRDRGPETENFPSYAKVLSSLNRYLILFKSQDSLDNPTCTVSRHIFKGAVYSLVSHTDC